jgi:hypothetical protein
MDSYAPGSHSFLQELQVESADFVQLAIVYVFGAEQAVQEMQLFTPAGLQYPSLHGMHEEALVDPGGSSLPALQKHPCAKLSPYSSGVFLIIFCDPWVHTHVQEFSSNIVEQYV